MRATSSTDNRHELQARTSERTLYWLKLLLQTEYISQTEYDSISVDAIEIIKILTTSIKTAKNVK